MTDERSRVPKTPQNVFGKTLRKIRDDQLGMSGEQFAAALGVSVGTVRAWEQGSGLPVGENAWALLHLVGLESFVSLMPHVRPDASVLLPVQGGEATIISLSGSRNARLARLVAIAEEIAREESGSTTDGS